MTTTNKYKLKNKLTVLLTPQKETQAVAVLVMVGVGSRYESENIAGIAHFIEHMLFKGTKKRPTTLALSKELDKVGAQFNAYTADDHTCFYIKINKENLKIALDLLSDMLWNSKLEKKEVEREKGTIIEEIHMQREDNPQKHTMSLLAETIFKGNKLGHDGLGTKKTVKAITQKQIKNFKNKYYIPQNIVIGIAGNINLKEIKNLIKKYFTNSRVSSHKNIKFEKFKPKQTQPRINLKYKNSAQAHLAFGFLGPSLIDKDYCAGKLLALILGGSMSSRLFIKIRERQGLCYHIHSDLDSYQDTGVLDIYAGLDKNRIEQAIKLILKELKKIKDKGVTTEELKRAQENLKGHLILNLEESQNLASWYAQQQLLIGKTKTPEQRIYDIMKVKKVDVEKAAKKIFQTNKINLAMIGPFKDKQRFKKLLKI